MTTSLEYRLNSIEDKLSKFEKPSLLMKVAQKISKKFAFNDRIRKFSIDVNYYILPKEKHEYKDYFNIDSAIFQINSLSDNDIIQMANEFNTDVDTTKQTIIEYKNRLEGLKSLLYANDIRFVTDVVTT